MTISVDYATLESSKVFVKADMYMKNCITLNIIGLIAVENNNSGAHARESVQRNSIVTENFKVRLNEHLFRVSFRQIYNNRSGT